ncbi:MAG: hypothetical protein RLZZ15_3856 [Verrucomicrobiota bacterium]
MSFRPFSLLLGLLAGLAVPASAANDDLAARVDAFIGAEMARQKIPGVAVAIVQGREVRLAKGYGLANVEHQVPVTVDTIFQSGSLGKQFTAALAMLLIEDGKLALTDPLAKYLPDAPAAWSAITVRHLLTHTSGIPDYDGPGFDYERNYTEAEITRLSLAGTLIFPPGARWAYSNTGYTLLGFIEQKAAGRSYGDMLHERIFGPTGMKTARIINEADIVPHRAAGYRLVKGELKNQKWVSAFLNTTADGSLYFSLNDLIAWDQAWRRRALLKPASWDLMVTPVRLRSGKNYPYGFGIFLDENRGQKIERHSGSWQGFKTYRVRYLGGDFSVLILANLAQANPETLGEGVAKLVNPEFATPAVPPPPKDEPTVARRLERLLTEARDGKLLPTELAWVRGGLTATTAKRLADALTGLTLPGTNKLTERQEIGDDVIYSFELVASGKTLLVQLGISSDDKVSTFSIAPKP